MDKEKEKEELNIELKSMSKPAVDENGMTRSEKNKILEMAKGFQKEDFNVAITVFPDDVLWTELMRRNNAMYQKIKEVESIIGVELDNVQSVPALAWNELKKRYDDLREKFVKVRNVFGGKE